MAININCFDGSYYCCCTCTKTLIYFEINQAIESLGLKLVEISIQPIKGIDREHFQKAIKKFEVKACVFVLNFNNRGGSCRPDQHKNSYSHCICTSFGKPWNDDVDYSLIMLGKLIKKML